MPVSVIRRRDLLARILFLGTFGRARLVLAAQGRSAEPAPGASRLIGSIDGPLVVTSNLARQREMFEGAFGLVPVADQELSVSAVRNLFGLKDRTARTLLLQTKGTTIGVRLVEFRPGSSVAARDGARPADADALERIDFMAPDFDRAVAALSARGFGLAAPASSYSTPEDGRFTQGHIEGPDGVACSLLQMHDTSLSKYATVIDQTFTEILRISAPVSDRNAAMRFYGETLRLKSVRGYEVADGIFAKVPGTKETTLRREANFGAGAAAPTIGVIDWGLPSRAFRSLRDRSVLPHRGLQAIGLAVPSTGAVANAASAAGLEIVAGPVEEVLFPQGRVKSVLIRAPHGVLHHFTETLKA